MTHRRSTSDDDVVERTANASTMRRGHRSQVPALDDAPSSRWRQWGLPAPAGSRERDSRQQLSSAAIPRRLAGGALLLALLFLCGGAARGGLGGSLGDDSGGASASSSPQQPVSLDYSKRGLKCVPRSLVRDAEAAAAAAALAASASSATSSGGLGWWWWGDSGGGGGDASSDAAIGGGASGVGGSSSSSSSSSSIQSSSHVDVIGGINVVSLDLSGNALTTLASEVGLLTTLTGAPVFSHPSASFGSLNLALCLVVVRAMLPSSMLVNRGICTP